MKHFLLSLVCLIMPSFCFAQVAIVDQENGITIKNNLNTVDYGATRTIYFDNNDGSSVEANLPADMGYIYIYDSKTRKGVVEFSRTNRYYAYPLYDYGGSCYYSRSGSYYRHGR